MIRNSFSLSAYRPLTAIKVAGEDAFTFLQGQFTNDLRQEVGGVTYGLWLNQKGKVLADSHVLKLAENEFLLVSATSPAAVIIQRLEQYIIADDVVLTDETGMMHGLALWGEGGGEALKQLLGAAPTQGKFLKKSEMMVFGGHRTKGENYEIIGPEIQIDDVRKQLMDQGWIEATADERELARISAAIPAIPQDIGPSDLPNEAGLESTAISFTKGCYLGQEVMARLKNLGQVRRQLRRVRGEGDVPKAGMPLFQGAKKMGEIRSAVLSEEGFVALAMVTRMGLDESAGFNFEPTDQPRPTPTVWMN